MGSELPLAHRSPPNVNVNIERTVTSSSFGGFTSSMVSSDLPPRSQSAAGLLEGAGVGLLHFQALTSPSVDRRFPSHPSVVSGTSLADVVLNRTTSLSVDELHHA